MVTQACPSNPKSILRGWHLHSPAAGQGGVLGAHGGLLLYRIALGHWGSPVPPAHD